MREPNPCDPQAPRDEKFPALIRLPWKAFDPPNLPPKFPLRELPLAKLEDPREPKLGENPPRDIPAIPRDPPKFPPRPALTLCRDDPPPIREPPPNIPPPRAFMP